MSEFVLGPEITVEQLRRAKRILQGQEDVYLYVPEDPAERENYLKIIEDALEQLK